MSALLYVDAIDFITWKLLGTPLVDMVSYAEACGTAK